MVIIFEDALLHRPKALHAVAETTAECVDMLCVELISEATNDRLRKAGTDGSFRHGMRSAAFTDVPTHHTKLVIPWIGSSNPVMRT